MRTAFTAFIRSLAAAPFSLVPYAMAFCGLILARLAIEGSLGGFAPHSPTFLFFEFSHTFLFFLFSLLLFIPLFSFLARESYSLSAHLLLFGFLIILCPPLIDKLVFGSQPFWSFYEFDGLRGLFSRYFTLFGETPRIGITYGVRAEVVLVSLGVLGYASWKTGSRLRGLMAGAAAYSLLFVLGTFPSWLTFLLELPHQAPWSVTRADVAARFLTPEPILGREAGEVRSVLNMKMSLWYALLSLGAGAWLLIRLAPEHFRALWKNIRLPQALYHGGLVSLGALLALHYEGLAIPRSPFDVLAFLCLLMAAVFAWIASVIVNDLHDQRTDALTNKDRPLIIRAIPEATYRAYGLIAFLVSLILAGIVGFHALLLLLLYQGLAWIYSVPPFRLKRFPGLATLLASFACFLVFATGYLSLSQSGSLASLPPLIVLYLIAAYAAVLPLKDFKDIEGDRRDHVYTLPVLLGEQKAKLFIGSALFLGFALSPAMLNISQALPLALFFATLAFWVLQKAGDRDGAWCPYQRLPAYMLGITFLYGLTLLLLLWR